MMVILTAVARTVAPLPEPTRDDILQRILPATVQVVIEQREGSLLRSSSGVAVASRATSGATECFILTSGHTVTGVQEHRQVYVFFGRHLGGGVGEKLPATVLAYRETNDLDLAVVRTDNDGYAPIRLARRG
jgi:S1-C subfamily serine protease